MLFFFFRFSDDGTNITTVFDLKVRKTRIKKMKIKCGCGDRVPFFCPPTQPVNSKNGGNAVIKNCFQELFFPKTLFFPFKDCLKKNISNFS